MSVKKGFTLAEVLITLGIIGIVAAMTIPALMNNVQDYQLKQAWKKEYSVISQATVSVLKDIVSFKGAYVTYDHDALKNKYINYLRTSKVCTGDLAAPATYGYCWHSIGITKYLNGNAVLHNNMPLGGGSAGIVLQDGAYVLFSFQDPSCASNGILTGYSEAIPNICGSIAIDVNGQKKPNIVGKDTFGIWILDNRIVPMGTIDNSCNSSSLGLGCSAKYLQE